MKMYKSYRKFYDIFLAHFHYRNYVVENTSFTYVWIKYKKLFNYSPGGMLYTTKYY